MSLTTEQLQRLRTLQGALSALSYEYEDVLPLLATEANATANKNAIIAAIPTGYALQGNGQNTLTDLYNLIGYTISEIDAV